jgi:hypothetical protein
MMVEEDFPTSFSTGLARKDAGHVLEAAGAHDLRMKVAEAVAARFDEAIEAGDTARRTWRPSTRRRGRTAADGVTETRVGEDIIPTRG